MLTNLAIKRILSDIKYLKNNSLNDLGIYHIIDESNISNMKILIIGPKDTPYEGGFFLFDIEFPEDYPLYPPVVTFRSLSNNVRFNPNLYTSGKVCLSLLNTWSGPSWTPQNTIYSVLLSLLSMVFNEEPLRNEPGYEFSSNLKIQTYNRIIEYETYNLAIIKILKDVPYDFYEFNDIIQEYFNTNYNKYLDILKKYKKVSNNKNYIIDCYDLNIKCDYNQLLKILKDMDINKKINNRKCPNDKANLYYEGYKMISENNEKLYIIKKNKNNLLFWSLN